MGYKRQTFVDGETVLSAGHLEHIEEGIIEAEQNHNSLQREVETLKQNGTGSGGAELTAENIKSALGYTPADDADVSKLQEEKVDQKELENYALKNEIPTAPVQSVNGKTGAVQLSASDVGARPNTWTPSASEVGADANGTAELKVSEHNTSEASHNDIRLLISGLTSRLNALANSDDSTLDQMAEVVAYIKNNKSLIDGITTSKVNVSDIIDNLTTSVSNKPLSAKQGVQLKALIDAIVVPTKTSQLQNDSNFVTRDVTDSLENEIDNLEANKQPLGDYAFKSEIPSIPVKSVNGKTGTVVLNASDVGAITEAWVQTQITDLKAMLNQFEISLAEGSTLDEQLAWLNDNGDTTKVYVLLDGFVYAYMKTTGVGGSAYTNILPTATKGTDQATGWVEGGGYTQNARLSGSSGTVTTNYTSIAGMCVSGYISAKIGDVVRIKNFYSPDGVAGYVVTYDTSKTRVANKQFGITDGNQGFQWGGPDFGYSDWYTVEGIKKPEGVTTFTLTEANFGANIAYIRFSGIITENTIITINEEIVEGGVSVIVEKWASTGHAFAPANYDGEIANLKIATNAHTAEIQEIKDTLENVEKGISNLTEAEKLGKIKNWNKPVYDYSEITLLSDDRRKPSLSTSDRTVNAVYAKYRALMAKYPKYITETNLGKSTASDTFAAVDILRFDFKEPDGLVQSASYTINETKPKIILMTGVHNEYAGIYGLYYALEEIAENPDFDDIRRNAHIIVVPCSNPFGLTSQTQIDEWQMSHVNANGVAIHNNFGVEYNTYNANVPLGSFNYGGTEAYSELETQYIDNLMAENSDAIAFVSCHNFNNDLVFGSMAIWASSATAYMCNLAFRLIDKISKAWHNKYGDALKNGIDTYKNENLPDGEYRLGYAQFSTSAGTEQLNATKYGIQATNLEISDNMRAFSNSQFSSDVMTHGAEVYANYLRIILSSYNYTDKEEQYK